MTLKAEIDERRASYYEAIRLAEEMRRRVIARRLCYDPKLLTEILYPKEDPSFRPLWDRWSERTDWLLQLRLAFKMRQSIEVPPGFEVVLRGRSYKIDKPRWFDLSKVTTLHIRQSRETLKSAVARIDAIHDLIFFSDHFGVPPAVVFWNFKLERAYETMDAVVSVLPRLHEYFPKRFPARDRIHTFGTKQPIPSFNLLDKPGGVPERSCAFLAIKTKYTGGRYKSGHGDDLVNEEDWVSSTVREERARDINAREFERDKLWGRRTIQGTDWHPEDAHQRLEKRKNVFTVKLPCIRGDRKRLFVFFNLTDEEKKKRVRDFTEELQPMFPHLDLMTLDENYWNTSDDHGLWCAQMLLDATMGGNQVFNADAFVWATHENVKDVWPCAIFLDPAIKEPKNMLSGDYMAIGVVAWDDVGRKWLIDGEYRNDWQETDLFQELGRLLLRYQPFAVYAPKKELTILNPRYQEHAMQQNYSVAWMTPLKEADSANKMQRIKGLEPDFRRNRIVLVRDVPICNAVDDEARKYDSRTGAAKHDDALDMLAQTNDSVVGKPAVTGRYEGFESEDDPFEDNETCFLP